MDLCTVLEVISELCLIVNKVQVQVLRNPLSVFVVLGMMKRKFARVRGAGLIIFSPEYLV